MMNTSSSSSSKKSNNHNNTAIECNNFAVSELRCGNIRTAYALLREACEKMYQQQQSETNNANNINNNNNKNDEHNKRHHATGSPPAVYRFGWIDCTEPITRQLQKDEVYSTRSQDTSSTSFMYFKLVTIVDTPPPTAIGMPQQQQQQGGPSCPCGFAWAVWYNVGIVSAVLASLQGKLIDRRNLLEQALVMFGRAEEWVSLEPPSKHWSLLSLSILNNQACVLKDLSLDDQILERLVNMGLTLTNTMSILKNSDVEPFHWTIQLLVQDRFAPAA